MRVQSLRRYVVLGVVGSFVLVAAAWAAGNASAQTIVAEPRTKVVTRVIHVVPAPCERAIANGDAYIEASLDMVETQTDGLVAIIHDKPLDPAIDGISEQADLMSNIAGHWTVNRFDCLSTSG